MDENPRPISKERARFEHLLADAEEHLRQVEEAYDKCMQAIRESDGEPASALTGVPGRELSLAVERLRVADSYKLPYDLTKYRALYRRAFRFCSHVKDKDCDEDDLRKYRDFAFPGWTDELIGCAPLVTAFAKEHPQWRYEDFEALMRTIQDRGCGYVHPHGVLQRLKEIRQANRQDVPRPEKLLDLGSNWLSYDANLSRDGELLPYFLPRDNALLVWSLSARRLVARLPLPEENAFLCVSSYVNWDHSVLLCVIREDRGGMLTAWSPAEERVLWEMRVGEDAFFPAVADKVFFLTGDDGDVRVYSLTDGAPLLRFHAHEPVLDDNTWSAGVQPQPLPGNRLLTGGSDGCLKLWQLDGDGRSVLAETDLLHLEESVRIPKEDGSYDRELRPVSLDLYCAATDGERAIFDPRLRSAQPAAHRGIQPDGAADRRPAPKRGDEPAEKRAQDLERRWQDRRDHPGDRSPADRLLGRKHRRARVYLFPGRERGGAGCL